MKWTIHWALYTGTKTIIKRPYLTADKKSLHWYQGEHNGLLTFDSAEQAATLLQTIISPWLKARMTDPYCASFETERSWESYEVVPLNE